MYSHDAELLFPPKIIPALRGLRSESWEKVIDQIELTSQINTKRMAFVLLMVRMNGCISCSADSYKAMRGCQRCASQSIQKFPGTDRDIVQMFEDAIHEIENYVELSVNI